jgi:hypothetical protein
MADPADVPSSPSVRTGVDRRGRLVVHRGGRGADPGPQGSASPAGVPPATRAQGRIFAPAPKGRHVRRRRRRPMVVAAVGTVAAGAALAGIWVQRDTAPGESTAAPPPAGPAGVGLAPAQQVIESTLIRPVAVAGVSARTTPSVLLLRIDAQHETAARVLVAPLDGTAPARRLTLSIRGATERSVTLPDLASGRYRWQVLVSGQPGHTGTVMVPAPPPPVATAPVPVFDEVTDQVTDQVTDEVTDEVTDQSGTADARTRSDGGGSDGGRGGEDPQQLTGVSSGPNRPVDPDGD